MSATLSLSLDKTQSDEKESDQQSISNGNLSGLYVTFNEETQQFDINPSVPSWQSDFLFGPDSKENLSTSAASSPKSVTPRTVSDVNLPVTFPRRDPNKTDVRLLFLDVDGVLNYSGGNQLCEPQLTRLRSIVDSVPNCKIVISSSWRLFVAFKRRLLSALQEVAEIDVPSVVIGETPVLTDDDVERKYKVSASDTDNLFNKRPFEIKSYLETDRVLRKNFNVLQWCVVDDLPLAKFNAEIMGKHFVQTKDTVGLTDTETKLIIDLLNKNLDDKEFQHGAGLKQKMVSSAAAASDVKELKLPKEKPVEQSSANIENKKE